MRRKLFFMIFRKSALLGFLLLWNMGHSQAPTVIWSKFFGGAQSEAHSIIKTFDGGYMVAGMTQSAHSEAVNFHNSKDGFVVKLNSEFVREWSYCYGTGSTDLIHKIIQTSDGNFVFVGTSVNLYPNNTGFFPYDIWIVKINTLGSVIWEKRYGGSDMEEGWDIIETPDGQLIVTGQSGSADYDVNSNQGGMDYLILKLDSAGNLLSNISRGGPDFDYGYATVLNSDGSFVTVGQSASESGDINCISPTDPSLADWWVIKHDVNGELAWTKCYKAIGGPTTFRNCATSILKTSDNGYIILGYAVEDSANGGLGSHDVVLRKVDQFGEIQWKRVYGGSFWDGGARIKQTMDGGYIIVGRTDSVDQDITPSAITNGQRNAWMIKVDASGVLNWQKVIGSTNVDEFSDIVEISPDEFLASGTTYGNDNDVSNSNNRDFWICKINGPSLSVGDFNPLRDIVVAPNPANDSVSFETLESIKKIALSDMLGRTVRVFEASDIKEIDLSTLQSGSYVLTISNDQFSTTKKIVKQ